MKNKLLNWKYWYEEWVKPIVIAVVLALIIRTFFMQPFKIPTSSMEPTLRPGDRIFVNKMIYGARIPFTNIRLPEIREPEVGDLVVFLSPEEDGKHMVKRYIAGPAQTVRISGGDVYVNGEKIDRFPMEQIFYYNHPGPYGSDESFLVPENSFFVLGDNSANSMDSRYWGFVPYGHLVGRVSFVHWPPHRIQRMGEDK